MRVYETSTDATGLRFGVVVSRFNHLISVRLLEGCTSELVRRGARADDLRAGTRDRTAEPTDKTATTDISPVPAPDTGALVEVNGDGSFTTITEGLDRPTSLEFIGNTAYVVTLTGEIWEIDGVSAPPYGVSP